MAMGRRQHREWQEDLWVAHTQLAAAPGRPFYERLNAVLDDRHWLRGFRVSYRPSRIPY